MVDHQDDSKKLDFFDKPVLLVKGTGSAPFLHTIIDLLAQNLPDAEIIELPGGHAPHLVSTKEFLVEFRKFVSN